MSFFAKGDFNIRESWDEPPQKSQLHERDPQNALQQVKPGTPSQSSWQNAKPPPRPPSTLNTKPPSTQPRPPTSSNKTAPHASPASQARTANASENRSTALVNAGKNLLQPPTDLIDDRLSQRIFGEFLAESPHLAGEFEPKSAKGNLACRKDSATTTDANPFKATPLAKKNPSGVSNHPSISKSPEEYLTAKPSSGSSSGGDRDLMSSMASKLAAVERTCANQRKELEAKSHLVRQLKEENELLKASQSEPATLVEKVRGLEEERLLLQRKCEEMEAYLGKYGLKWVGAQLQGELDAARMKKDLKQPAYNFRLPTEIDINTIVRRMEDLNGRLHSEGKGSEVCFEHGVHKLKPAEPLAIGFFADGIAMKGFKFCAYSSQECQRILSDIFEGYFPYPLKNKYPEGVFLKAVDHVETKYESYATQEAIETLQSKEGNQFRPPSKAEFLEQLPKQVIKDGKVFNIREEIAKKLEGGDKVSKWREGGEFGVFVKEGVKSLPSLGLRGKAEGLDSQPGVRPGSAEGSGRDYADEDTCTLKLRDESGDTVRLLVHRESSMAAVYGHIKRAFRGNFQLVGLFPRTEF